MSVQTLTQEASVGQSTAFPTYSLAERDRRWQLARDLMEEQGVDALITYGDREGSFPAPFAHDNFFTNDRPGAIVIFPRHGEPISIVAFPMAVADHMEARLRHEAVWIRPENVFAGKRGATIAELIKKLGLAHASIGVIGLDPYPPYYFEGAIPYNTWHTVLADLPHAKFEHVQKRFLEMIARRSDEEIAALKWCAQIGEKMCEAMLAATRPGVSEGDIYSAAMEACPKNGGFAGLILLGSGHEYFAWGPPSWIYRPHAPRTIRKGDVILAEVFCQFGMLETQHQPTIAIGDVHPDFEKAAAAARRSYEAGLRALVSGGQFGDVVDAMEEPIRHAGGQHVHPWIHSINPFGNALSGFAGFSQVPGASRYGRVGQIPRIGNDLVLQPGMSFAFEPNCAFGRHVANLGGTVVVGENQPIELDRVSTNLMRA